MRRFFLLLMLLGTTSACVLPVFNSPRVISTNSEIAAHAKRLEQVSVEWTQFVFVFIPFPLWFDHAGKHDDLLAKAKAAGGNAVVDVEIRNKDMLFVVPLFYKVTWEAVGTAAIIETKD